MSCGVPIGLFICGSGELDLYLVSNSFHDLDIGILILRAQLNNLTLKEIAQKYKFGTEDIALQVDAQKGMKLQRRA